MTSFAGLFCAISFLPWFEARNDLACRILEPPGGEAAEAAAPEAMRPSLETRAECPVCGGAGVFELEEPDLGQNSGRIGKARKVREKCRACGGRGKVDCYVDPDSLAAGVARDREKFESAHLAKGDVPAGEAFIPARLFVAKDKRTKLVAKAFGEPCRTCQWTGLERCKKCSGQGVVKCPNEDCKGGWAVVTATTSYSRSKSGGSSGGSYHRGFSSGGSRRVSRKETKTNVTLCPECGGAAKILCPECGGKKARACRKCSGTGLKRKGSY